MTWVRNIIDTVEREGACARVVIVATEGPTPRAVGASMLIWMQGQSGKIGRGPIEVKASEHARTMLADFDQANSKKPAWPRSSLSLPTGNVLGESTGGRVHLLIELFGRAEAEALKQLAAQSPHYLFSRPLVAGLAPNLIEQKPGGPTHLGAGKLLSLQHAHDGPFLIERLAPLKPAFHVYGSGLVARALVKCLVDLPFDVRWLDRYPGHFPRDIPAGATHVVHDDLAAAAQCAPSQSLHAVMTADHDLDMAICKTLLEADDFQYLGVIGSPLKRERIDAKLLAAGISPQISARLSCPIGLSGIRSKDPAVIAVSIAAQALTALEAA